MDLQSTNTGHDLLNRVLQGRTVHAVTLKEVSHISLRHPSAASRFKIGSTNTHEETLVPFVFGFAQKVCGHTGVKVQR